MKFVVSGDRLNFFQQAALWDNNWVYISRVIKPANPKSRLQGLRKGFF